MSAPLPLRPEPLPGQNSAAVSPGPATPGAAPAPAPAPAGATVGAGPSATGTPAVPAAALPEGWRPGPAEDRLPALLGFALAAEAGGPLRAEEAPARRAEAERLMTEWAFRHLHNRLDEIRREAVAEAQARQPRPPGFATLLLANLLALAIAGGAWWLAVRGGFAFPGR
jgi:hypothetical protein